MTTDYEVIVVGVGGVGSAALAHLARRGVDVLGLERYDVPHAMGSSHGVTRIIRKAYHEHPDYVPLVERAYELWRDLDAGHDRELLHVVGSLAAGEPDSGLVAGARTACERHDLPHEVLDAGAVRERFPAFDLPDGFAAVHQPEGGFLWAEQAIVAHVLAARDAGGTVRARERVTDWTATGGGVRVETDRDGYTADRLVVAAGAWTPKLLPAFREVLTPQRQVLGWFQPSEPGRFAPERCPVFVVERPSGEHFYGFPRFHVPGVKVGKHYHFGETVDPDAMPREPRRADERALRGFLDWALPAADGPAMALSTCLYTNTPDRRFVIDRHPAHGEVTVACGFSGHGFKFASVVGEVLADLALEGQTDHPIERFRASRLDL